MKALVGMLVWAVASFAWAQQPSDKLGVGDALRITVFQQPDLTTETRITDRGTVSMPLIGEVKVAGLSAHQASSHIADALKKGQYLKNPQVTVAVTTMRSQQVSVIGLVPRPGRYGLEDTNYKVADVIAAAGGVGPEGSTVVTVIRDGKPQKVDILKTSFALKSGDTVVVDRAPVFYIYGEVARSGAYRVEDRMTVMQALAAGGGITPRGSERRVKLRRAGADGKIVETDVSLQDTVKANDTIYVKEALF